jgi:pimeloyl-ACP methyl ester carboxylesterase
MTITAIAPLRSTWRETTIRTSRLRFHAIEAGPANGRLLVLLHGFPEFWYAWRNYIDEFADLGFHVVVPDQRGYNLSDKPVGRWNYTTNKLAADAAALIDALNAGQACVVGHDWGGHVAWAVAEQYPTRIARMVILNVAHPKVMVRTALTNPRQAWKSWYGIAFQVPWLPEILLRIGDCALLRRGLRKRGVTVLPADEARAYVAAWTQPGALSGMLNWYRGLLLALPLGKLPRIQVPTLLLWGERDQFLVRELATRSIELCVQGELAFFANATHWLHHEEAAAVRDRITRFLH